MHMAQVRPVFALLLRRADAQEMHVGELGRHVVVGGEPSLPAARFLVSSLRKPGS